MDTRKFTFLQAVLGDDGARALAKAAERAPELEAALLPRTIMAWLGVAGRDDFEGQIPGVENTYIQFQKHEDRYSGSVAIASDVYSFEKASMLHLGACMAVALGADHERVAPSLKDLDIQRLGKSIDTLAKARVALQALQKSQPRLNSIPSHIRQGILAAPTPHEMAATIIHHEPELAQKWGGREYLDCDEVSTILSDALKHKGIAHDHIVGENKIGDSHAWVRLHDGTVLDPTEQGTVGGEVVESFAPGMAKAALGAEAPGPAHAPTPPDGPVLPTPPVPNQTSKGPTVGLKPAPPKPPKPSHPSLLPEGKAKNTAIKVTKSEAERKCLVCAGTQFKSGRFAGCICFRDLAKAVKATVIPDGYNLEFGLDWDQDSILTLLESLGKK